MITNEKYTITNINLGLLLKYDGEYQNDLSNNQNGNYKIIENFELISKIRFNQLNEINLSGNSIINIGPLNKMILPFLEYLNLSNNKIENIKPVANLKSKKLKEIFLHHNDIKDISPFEDSEFPKLEILRIECNENLNKEGKYDIIKKIFKNQIIDEEQTFEKFNENYNCNISKQDKKIELRNKKEKGNDKMIIIIAIFLK